MKLYFIICIVFYVIQGCFGAMDTDKLQISVFKNNIKAGRYVCGQDLIVEENNDVRLEIYSPNKYDSYIYEAWCDRNDGRNIGITIENGHLLYTNVRGADDFEGKWNCTMLITENVNIRYPHVKDSVQNEINCELNVIVKRYVTLIISDKTDGTNFNVTNDQKHYYYAPGQIVDLKCVKNNETQEVLDSGTMELAICNEIDKLCSGVSNSTNRVIELKEKAIKENCIIRCTFKSVHGIETSAEIVLKLKDLKLQKITVDDNNVWNKDDYFLYEVATSESGDSVVKCTKSEDQYYGSLHWEYCGKENEWRTSTCEIHAKKYENMITWPISRQKQTADILKCVYTYDSRSPIREAVVLIIRVIGTIRIPNKFLTSMQETTADPNNTVVNVMEKPNIRKSSKQWIYFTVAGLVAVIVVFGIFLYYRAKARKPRVRIISRRSSYDSYNDDKKIAFQNQLNAGQKKMVQARVAKNTVKDGEHVYEYVEDIPLAARKATSRPVRNVSKRPPVPTPDASDSNEDSDLAVYSYVYSY